MADADDEPEVLEGERPGAPAGLRRRGIYLLPNLFTLGVLFCGFFAIVQAMNGRFDVGCIAIFIAMVLDGMDGRIARLLRANARFRGVAVPAGAHSVVFSYRPRLVEYGALASAATLLGCLGWVFIGRRA